MDNFAVLRTDSRMASTRETHFLTSASQSMDPILRARVTSLQNRMPQRSQSMIRSDQRLRARVALLQSRMAMPLSSAQDVLEYALWRHPDYDDDFDDSPVHSRANRHLVSRH